MQFCSFFFSFFFFSFQKYVQYNMAPGSASFFWLLRSVYGEETCSNQRLDKSSNFRQFASLSAFSGNAAEQKLHSRFSEKLSRLIFLFFFFF